MELSALKKGSTAEKRKYLFEKEKGKCTKIKYQDRWRERKIYIHTCIENAYICVH